MIHRLPGGSQVTDYQGQLATTGHKFGSHTLTITCPCQPDVLVTPETGLTTVCHKVITVQVPVTY